MKFCVGAGARGASSSRSASPRSRTALAFTADRALATVSPAKRRLRKRREFLAVQNGGRRVGGRHFLFFVRPRSDAGVSALAAETRFGITVTRKIGNAVTRNRVKRVVREGFREVAASFPAGLDLVVVARGSAPEAGASDVAAELRDLARRLCSRGGR